MTVSLYAALLTLLKLFTQCARQLARMTFGENRPAV